MFLCKRQKSNFHTKNGFIIHYIATNIFDFLLPLSSNVKQTQTIFSQSHKSLKPTIFCQNTIYTDEIYCNFVTEDNIVSGTDPDEDTVPGINPEVLDRQVSTFQVHKLNNE